MLRRSALLALALLSTAAAAQDSSATRGTFLLGVGRDLNANRGTGAGAALDAQAGYQRRLGNSRFSLRLSGDYGTSSSGGTFAALDFLSSSHVSVRTFDAAVSLTYALTRGRIQPYLIAGAGVQQMVQQSQSFLVTSAPFGDPSAPSSSYRLLRGSRSQWNPLLQGGVGVSARLRGVTLFGELRHDYNPGGLVSDRPALGVMPAPLTFGVRFD